MTTRDERGRLDEMLAAAGLDVVHVPLIEIGPPADGGAALDAALERLGEFEWVAVTSKHGARSVGRALRAHPRVRLAAVGTRTAVELAELAGRPVDVVPGRQTAADLAAAMPAPEQDQVRVLVAQADRAGDALVTGLRDAGYEVVVVIAYATRSRTPTAAERELALGSDAVVFASGSAAQAWADALGDATPAVVVAIGPTTEGVARTAGLKVTHVAADHSLEGLAVAAIAALDERP